jgi:hypothetical protein
VDTVEGKGMTGQLVGSCIQNLEEIAAKLVTRDDNVKCRFGRRTKIRQMMKWNLPHMRLLHTFNRTKLDWHSGKMTSKAISD